MGYGEYLKSIKGAYAPIATPSYFVPYDELKTTLYEGGPDAFIHAWEQSFTKLCKKLRQLRSNAELSEAEIIMLDEFQLANREALRKLMKKCDKIPPSELLDPQSVKQQPIRLRMTDCAFEALLEHISVEVAPPESDTLEPGSSNCVEKGVVPEAVIVGKRSATLQSLTSSLKTTPVNPSSTLVGLGMGVFFILVSFQPILADLTKDGHETIPYIESTVIGIEAALSCILGMLLSKTVVRPKQILRYSPVGLLRAVEDTLSIVCLNYIDPTLYAMLCQFRLVLTGVSAWCCLSKAPNKLQIQAMVAITFVLLAFSNSYTGSSDFDTFGFVLALIAVVCKVAASVYLDKVMKEDGEVSVMVQNATISAATIPAIVTYSLAFERKRIITFGPLDGWSTLTVVLLVQLLVKNWLSNVIVKQYSAVVKYVIYALAVVGTYCLQRVIYKEEVTLLSFLLIVLLTQSVYSFADGKSWKFGKSS